MKQCLVVALGLIFSIASFANQKAEEAAAAYALRDFNTAGVKNALEAVSLYKELATKANPAESSPSLHQLDEGQLIKVEKYHNEWAQIRTQTGAPGWVPRDSIIEFKGR